jgi:hypothetical protein
VRLRLVPDDEPLARLKAVHPTTDVDRLWRLGDHALLEAVLVARDVYNEGRAMDPHRGGHASRIELVRELLELRARFRSLSHAERSALKVAVQRVPK